MVGNQFKNGHMKIELSAIFNKKNYVNDDQVGNSIVSSIDWYVRSWVDNEHHNEAFEGNGTVEVLAFGGSFLTVYGDSSKWFGQIMRFDWLTLKFLIFLCVKFIFPYAFKVHLCC